MNPCAHHYLLFVFHLLDLHVHIEALAPVSLCHGCAMAVPPTAIDQTTPCLVLVWSWTLSYIWSIDVFLGKRCFSSLKLLESRSTLQGCPRLFKYICQGLGFLQFFFASDKHHTEIVGRGSKPTATIWFDIAQSRHCWVHFSALILCFVSNRNTIGAQGVEALLNPSSTQCHDLMLWCHATNLIWVVCLSSKNPPRMSFLKLCCQNISSALFWPTKKYLKSKKVLVVSFFKQKCDDCDTLKGCRQNNTHNIFWTQAQ